VLAIRDIANGGCNEGMLAGKRTQADLERRLRPVVSPCEQVEVAAHSADAEMFRISTTVVDVSCAEALGQPQLAALPDHLSRLAPNKANTWRLPNTMRPDASMITTASGANSSTLLSTSIDLPIRLRIARRRASGVATVGSVAAVRLQGSAAVLQRRVGPEAGAC